MLNGLQQKWKVGALQLLLILCTFAVGGSLTGYAGRQLLLFLHVERGVLWVVLYVVFITIIWPFSVLLISVFFGQFSFFKRYLRKMGVKMRLLQDRSLAHRGEQSTFGAVQNDPNKDDDQSVVPFMQNDPDKGATQPTFKSKGNNLVIDDDQSAIHSMQVDPDKNDQQISTPNPTRIAIFASGAGSNAEKIIAHFGGRSDIEVALIVCNNSNAGVLDIARSHQIPTWLIEKKQNLSDELFVDQLQMVGIRFIILAGFLWKIPDNLVAAFPKRIINIHPALLPKYGGKGMYGRHVHEAVLAAGDQETGITIHYVDGQYDHGAIIFQATCPVFNGDTADLLAARVHQLEHAHYSRVIEEIISIPLK